MTFILINYELTNKHDVQCLRLTNWYSSSPLFSNHLVPNVLQTQLPEEDFPS